MSLHETAVVAPSLTAEAARWYTTHAVPSAFLRLPPAAVEAARLLCGGDWQRCVTDADGSITVCNTRQWTHEPPA